MFGRTSPPTRRPTVMQSLGWQGGYVPEAEGRNRFGQTETRASYRGAAITPTPWKLLMEAVHVISQPSRHGEAHMERKYDPVGSASW